MNPVLAELHEAHKARQARFRRKAFVVLPKPAPEAEACNSTVLPMVIDEPPLKGDDQDAHVTAFMRFKLGLWTSTPTVALIIAATCRAYGVEAEDLLSARRTKNVVLPRHVAMWISCRRTGKSLPDIGRRFGGRDHTTILHAVRRVNHLRGCFPEVVETIAEIEVDIEANFVRPHR